MLKVNNKDTRATLLTCSVIFIVNIEQIKRLFIVFLLLDFEQVNVCWVAQLMLCQKL